MKGGQKTDVFQYTDYRQYLRGWYAAAKASRGSFSFRRFSSEAGFTSPNYFKMVMDGDRNLSEESLNKFVIALGLNKQEQEYFRNLVFFNQAKSHDEKDGYYRKFLQLRKFNLLKPIDKHQYEYYSSWYHPVVRELVTSRDFNGTPEWIADRIMPAITPQQARKSLEILQELGMIEKTPSGSWKQSSSLVSTGPETRELVLLKYHQNLLELAAGALTQIPPEERDVSALTMGIAAERWPDLKKKVQEFRRDILKFVSMDAEPEKVVLLNMQLLPVTRDGKAAS
jgi:uncharacterized protein (TIGR02147 family)